MPDIDVPQPGQPVDDAAPSASISIAPLAALDEERRRWSSGMVQRVNQKRRSMSSRSLVPSINSSVPRRGISTIPLT